MSIDLVKRSFGASAVLAMLAHAGSASAASVGTTCDQYKPDLPHLYVAGSSAIKPFIVKMSKSLLAADKELVIYVSQGSCVGVSDALNGDLLPTGADLGIIGAAGADANDTCTVPASTKADIGVSDVFATSCAGVEALPKTIGDFFGPVQVMNFIVPKGADAATQSISAEAAYLVFGFDPASTDPKTSKSYADGTPWTSKDDIWIRGSGSGTQSMIATAIKVPPASWALNSYTDANSVKHAVANGSSEIVTRVGGATNLDPTIGILASTELDDNRTTLRGLAYQAYGQITGYWPDSTSSAKDKLNVRVGKYDIWGPLHLFTEIGSGGSPKSASVAEFIDFLNGKKPIGSDPLEIVKTEITKNLVPACAMQVSRDSEIGDLMSVNPTCSCFYEDVRLQGDMHKDFESVTGDACTACDKDSDCDNGTTCSYGFCEAI